MFITFGPGGLGYVLTILFSEKCKVLIIQQALKIGTKCTQFWNP
jgi:hypothetical protein